jgi:REP element-mobilizing transposase RayT
MVEYRHSAHAVWDIKYHLVWITKYRYKVLKGEVAERARDLIRQICQAREVVIIRGAVSPDHVHMLVQYIKGDRREDCRRSIRTCARSTGGNTCGHEGTFARRWAQSTKRRLRRTSRIRSGTRTIRGSRSRRPLSLEPALSRNELQAASAAHPTFSRNPTHRL